jgi:hypothetical protein
MIVTLRPRFDRRPPLVVAVGSGRSRRGILGWTNGAGRRGLGRPGHAQFGGKVVPRAGRGGGPGGGRRALRLPLRRPSGPRRRLAGRVVRWGGAERLGEGGPWVVGIVLRHGRVLGWPGGGDGIGPSGDARSGRRRIHESRRVRQDRPAARRAAPGDGPRRSAGRGPAQGLVMLNSRIMLPLSATSNSGR